MSDYFSVLGLDRGLSLESSDVDAAWSASAKAAHPDSSSGTVDESAELNEARLVVQDPLLRLEHWLELSGVDLKNHQATSIDEGLMSFFSSVNAALAGADEVISQIEAATTALGKALYAKKAVEQQLGIQSLLGNLKGEVETVLALFPNFENSALTGEFSEAIQQAGRLRYLRKWERECGDRLLRLISL